MKTVKIDFFSVKEKLPEVPKNENPALEYVNVLVMDKSGKIRGSIFGLNGYGEYRFKEGLFHDIEYWAYNNGNKYDPMK